MEGETNAIPEFYVSWSRDGDGKKGRNRNQKRKRDFSLFHIAGSIVAGHEGWRNRWRSPARELIDIWPCTTCYPSPAILGLHLRATPPRQTEGAHPSEFRTAAPPAGTFASFHRLCNPRDCVFGGIIIGENLLFSKSFFQQYSFLLLERAHERDNTICPFIQLFIKLNGISFPRIFLTPKHPSLDKMCISSSIEGIVFQIVISFDKTDDYFFYPREVLLTSLEEIFAINQRDTSVSLRWNLYTSKGYYYSSVEKVERRKSLPLENAWNFGLDFYPQSPVRILLFDKFEYFKQQLSVSKNRITKISKWYKPDI